MDFGKDSLPLNPFEEQSAAEDNRLERIDVLNRQFQEIFAGMDEGDIAGLQLFSGNMATLRRTDKYFAHRRPQNAMLHGVWNYLNGSRSQEVKPLWEYTLRFPDDLLESGETVAVKITEPRGDNHPAFEAETWDNKAPRKLNNKPVTDPKTIGLILTAAEEFAQNGIPLSQATIDEMRAEGSLHIAIGRESNELQTIIEHALSPDISRRIRQSGQPFAFDIQEVSPEDLYAIECVQVERTNKNGQSHNLHTTVYFANLLVIEVTAGYAQGERIWTEAKFYTHRQEPDTRHIGGQTEPKEVSRKERNDIYKALANQFRQGNLKVI